MNNRKVIIIIATALIALAMLYVGLSYILSPKIIFGTGSCIIEKKVDFGANVTINDCGHNLDIRIEHAKQTEIPDRFINLTELKVDGDDFIKRVNEGDPVQIIIFEGMFNFRVKPNLVFGIGQGIKFMYPDKEHKDWMVRVISIDKIGATLQIIHL